jgi:hypothetical protein
MYQDVIAHDLSPLVGSIKDSVRRAGMSKDSFFIDIKEMNNEYRHSDDPHSRWFHTGPGRRDVAGSSKLLSLKF